MKSCLLLTTLIIIIATGCTKIVAGPTEVIGPELTYTDRAIVTVGDAITNVTVYPPFSTAQDNHMNFLNQVFLPYRFMHRGKRSMTVARKWK